MKRLCLVTVISALLPVIALVVFRQSLRDERQADAALLMAISDMSLGIQARGSVDNLYLDDLRQWLAANSSHPLACIIREGLKDYDHDREPRTQDYRSGELQRRLDDARAMLTD